MGGMVLFYMPYAVLFQEALKLNTDHAWPIINDETSPWMSKMDLSFFVVMGGAMDCIGCALIPFE